MIPLSSVYVCDAPVAHFWKVWSTFRGQRVPRHARPVLRAAPRLTKAAVAARAAGGCDCRGGSPQSPAALSGPAPRRCPAGLLPSPSPLCSFPLVAQCVAAPRMPTLCQRPSPGLCVRTSGPSRPLCPHGTGMAPIIRRRAGASRRGARRPRAWSRRRARAARPSRRPPLHRWMCARQCPRR